MKNKIDFSAFKRYSKEYAAYPMKGVSSHLQRAFLHWYAQHQYTGQGEWVDLGSRLGSTVVPAARGLESSSLPMRKKAKRIHAFDRFYEEDTFGQIITFRQLEKMNQRKQGESFLPEFLEAVAPWKEYIETHAGNLNEKTWNGLPVEFLHAGAMNSWEMTNRITRQFYSRLLPGDSYVVHPNFANCEYSFIHLQVYHLRDYLHPVFHIPKTGSLVLQTIKRVPERLAKRPLRPSDFSEQDVEKAYAYCRSLVDKEKEACVAAGQAMFQLSSGNTSAAADTLRCIEAEGLKTDPRCDCIDTAWKAVYSRGHVGFYAATDSGVYFGA